MEFSWTYTGESPVQLKKFIKEQGVSRALLSKIKFQGGEIRVDGRVQNVLYLLKDGETLTVTMPTELEHETVLVDEADIEIVYEDPHYLVVNKPAETASIPSQYHPNGTMANRVKNYYKKMNYPDQVIHVVTRLDRDTTGLMLFAKHSFAHGMLDKALRNKEVKKTYQAVVGGNVAELAFSGEIKAPITRDMTSLLKRKVGDGKEAHTSYKLLFRNDKIALVEVQLHTGRTHQIRVHFEYLGTPLLGDEMYGGRMDLGIKRQALHCSNLEFVHPFKGEILSFYQELPSDMAAFRKE
ncbi:MAG: RluA family pseudouridine synthase [Streptococcaceae bacterium]|nr:RluA family pseudouridine synthase [Streptococcaceae bacterium]